jgi:hypothetical protein
MNRAAIGKVFLVLRLTTRKIIVKPREAGLRARMALWVVLISILARLTSLPRAQRVASFGIHPASPGGGSATPAELARAIDSVLAIDLFVFKKSCWKRALVLHRFLALNGIESRINFGVQRAVDGSVHGHAWLEHQGRALLETDAGAYVVTFSLPLQGATRSDRSAG